MTWSTLPTFTDGNALTGAEMEAIVANIEETAPAKISGSFAASHIAAGDTANVIYEREITDDIIDTSESDNMTSFNDIGGGTVGPTLTIATGENVLWWMAAQQSNSSANVATFASVAFTGATTSAATDARGLITNAAASQPQRLGVASLNAVTPGNNTLTMQYRVVSNTGTWSRRRLVAMAL